jgi:hypothetical protein
MAAPTAPHTFDSPSTECRHCTVPTEGGDVCAFCASYEAPSQFALILSEVRTHTRYAVEDATDSIDALPEDAPLLAVADVVAARAHLIAAQRLIEKAARSIAAA